MLKITVIAVGKLKERFWRDACAEYSKRLGGYCNLTVREIPDSNREQESTLVLEALPENATIIVLDIQGKETSSEALASQIERYTVEGVSHLVFVIGGSDGLTNAVKERASLRMSFGRSRFRTTWRAWFCSNRSIAPSRSSSANPTTNKGDER